MSEPESYGAGHLPFTLSSYDIGSMGNDYQPESEAIAAMKLAIAADGQERQQLINLAMAWQELARMRAPPTSGGADEAP